MEWRWQEVRSVAGESPQIQASSASPTDRRWWPALRSSSNAGGLLPYVCGAPVQELAFVGAEVGGVRVVAHRDGDIPEAFHLFQA